MKIFRYKLRNGNFILISHKEEPQKAQKAHKAQKGIYRLVVFFVFYVPFVLFVASFSFRCGAVDVAHAANSLDPLETVQLVAQLLAQVTDVHVDAAIEG